MTCDEIFAPLFNDPEVSAAVSDGALIRALLDVEAALAEACAEVGLLPAGAAEAIRATCQALVVDAADLGRRSVRPGNPVVPLVSLLEQSVPGDARAWVHLGATSQDILDTALMLIARRAGGVVLGRLRAAADAAADLAQQHRDTVMLARTLGQQAVPTTFGRRVAGWVAGLDDTGAELDRATRRLAVQLGGAVGTRAGYGGAGASVAAALAGRLGLAVPQLPWHTERSRILLFAAALAAGATSCGKVAVDVLALAQSEVGEVSLATAGGSSAMPHKQNPVAAVLVSAGVRRVPGLLATLAAAGVHEQDRAAGAWHAEWQPWRELIDVVGGVAAGCATVLRSLEVHPDRMQRNLAQAGDAVLAESLAARLAGALGREAAHERVRRLVRGLGGSATLLSAAREDPEVSSALSDEELRAALDPDGWLGEAGPMVDTVLAQHRTQAGH